MTNSGKILRAALGGAILAWLLASLLLWIGFYAASPSPYEPEIIAFVAMYAMSSLPVCLIASLTLGVAWHVHALKRNWRRRSSYCIAGALCGAVLGPTLVLLSFGWSWWAHAGISLLYGATMGGLTGLYSWLILRPDRDAPNPDRAAP